MFLYAFLFYFVHTGFSFTSVPKPWVVVGSEIDDISDLRTQFPYIGSRSDMDQIIEEINFRYPAESLVVEENKDQFVIVLERAPTLRRIELNMLMSSQKRAIINQLLKFNGFVDNRSLRARIVRELEHYFANQGYFKPRILLDSSEIEPFNILYNIDIQPGRPCRIKDIVFSEPLPSGFVLAIQKGDICEDLAIRTAIENLEVRLKESGFAHINLSSFAFDQSQSSYDAVLRIQSELGRRIEYRVVEANRGYNLREIFLERDSLYHFNPSLMTPEAVKSELISRYRDRGHFDVEVADPIIRETDRAQVFEFQVTPGRAYVVNNISVTGNSLLTEKEVLAILNTKKFWEFKMLFRPDQFDLAMENVRAVYQEKSHWDASVTLRRMLKNADQGSVDLQVAIEEGPSYLLTELEIVSENPAIAEVVLEDDRRKSAEAPYPISREELAAIRRRLTESYRAKGYLFAEVKLDLKVANRLGYNGITIVVTIDSGPQVSIGRIMLRGLSDTKPEVVYRELRFGTGETYDPNAIERSRRALLLLGIFDNVKIYSNEAYSSFERPSIINIIVEVTESRQGSVSFGPGWSIYRGTRFAIDGTYRNIGGRGRQLLLRGALSEEAHQKEIGNRSLVGRQMSASYLEPYIGGLPINASFTAGSTARAENSWYFTNLVESNFIYRLPGAWEVMRIINFYRTELNREESDQTSRDRYLYLIGGNTRKTEVGLRVEADLRDDVGWPTSGAYLVFEYARALTAFGGNLLFRHWRGEGSFYFKSFEKTVIAVGVFVESFGDVKRLSGEANILPQSDVLHLGGSETVRGFSERSLGPILSYQAAGGSELLQTRMGGSQRRVVKTEIRRKVFSENFAASFFIDSGSLFFSLDELQSFEQRAASVTADSDLNILDNHGYPLMEMLTRPHTLVSKHYVSAGLSGSFITPLGSINLSYGLPLKSCAVDGAECVRRRNPSRNRFLQGAWHLSIGARF